MNQVHTILPVVIAAVALLVSHTQMQAAEPRAYILNMSPSPFNADIAGHKFSSMSALEQYMKTFAPGSSVDCLLWIGGLTSARESREAYLRRMNVYHTKLKAFCEKRHIQYQGGMAYP